MKKILFILTIFISFAAKSQVNIGSDGRVHSSSSGGTVTFTNELITGSDTTTAKSGIAWLNGTLYTYYGGKWNASSLQSAWDSVRAKQWTTWNFNPLLGYTPLNPANNLADVTSITTSRTNLNVWGKGDSSSYATAYQDGLKIPLSQKNANNGVAPLDAGGKVPVANLPSSLMIYKGLWDATTNSPSLANGSGTSGWVYQISNSGGDTAMRNWFGTVDTFYNNDYVMYNGSTWEISGDGNNVKSVSVNGSTAQQGVVSITLPNSSVTNSMLAGSIAASKLVGTDITLAESQITNLTSDLAAKLSATITSASTGQLIRYNGSAWVNWTPTYISSYTETDPIYTASSWAGTTNNSGNWNTAYSKRISSASLSSSTLTITLGDATTVTASVPTFNQSTTGSAATLTTPRAINGVNFDGSANITITAAAGTLTGTTLNSSVVSSSLTSVGTIGTGVWQGTAIADSYISSASTWNGKQAALSGTGFVKISGTTISYDNSTYITGNQTITLSGDVSGSGTTAITTTIGSGKVTNAMLAGSIDYAKMNSGTVPTWNQNTSGNAASVTITSSTANLTFPLVAMYAGGSYYNNAVYTNFSTGNLTAVSFSGAGTGLTGTASSLTAGDVSMNSSTANLSFPLLAQYSGGTYYNAGTYINFSTGALTLAGALSGTSASFSSPSLGVGTSSPQLPFHFKYASAGGYPSWSIGSDLMLIESNSNSLLQFLIPSNSYAAGFEVSTPSTRNLAGFYSNGTTATIHVNSTDAVTIASTGAATFSSSVTATSFNGAVGAGGGAYISMPLSGNNSSIGFYTNHYGVSSGQRMNIDMDGNITMGGTLGVTGYLTASGGAGTSDIRLKTNIVYNPSISILDSIDFIQYNMKDNLNRLRYGNIAQQVEKYYPDLVLTNDKGIKAIMYDDLQNIEIHELNEKVKILEKTILEIKSKLK